MEGVTEKLITVRGSFIGLDLSIHVKNGSKNLGRHSL
jgi:hypothetical protein